MDQFLWKKEYETGIEVIDAQHKELFEKINQFLLSFYENKEKEELIKISRFLQKYVEWHFDTEEKLFIKYLYPYAEEHIDEHDEFREFQKSVQTEINMGNITLSYAVKVENKLKDWWDHHILQSDMKYVPFLKGDPII